MDMIEDLHKSSEKSIIIDCHDLNSYSPELYQLAVMYPQEVVPVMDIVVNNLFEELKAPADVWGDEIQSNLDLISNR